MAVANFSWSVFMQRFLGVDYGDKRTGLAISDPTGTIARPLELLTGLTDEKTALRIAELVREYEVTTVVIGLPRNMDGSEGFRAERTRKFAETVEAALQGVPVEFFDERLTTMQAQRSLRLMDAGRKEKKGKIDTMAASLLLQSFLDNRSASMGSGIKDF
ncbi:MAG: Holliday junction resolvase RuvX [Planctomycetota bacterium]